MRCVSCDTILEDNELDIKGLHSEEYLDMCTRCIKAARIPVLDVVAPDEEDLTGFWDKRERDYEDYWQEVDDDDCTGC